MKGNINWKKELSTAFTPPKPREKNHFLNSLSYPKLRYREFLLSQVFYIRRRVWMVSGILILISCVFSMIPAHWITSPFFSEPLWLAEALLPFLALLAAAETARSLSWDMEELEMSCRYSLQQVIMARILLLGIINGIVFLSFTALMGRISAFGLWRGFLYLLVPYVLTCGICLFLLSHSNGREGLYGCAAAACAVSVLGPLLGQTADFLYTADHADWWIILSVTGIVIIILQTYQLLKKSEDKSWNLLSIR